MQTADQYGSSKEHQRAKKATELRSEVWDIPEWCIALGIGRTTYYRLDVKPRTVRLGKLIKVIESPSQYAERIAVLQQIEQGAAQ